MTKAYIDNTERQTLREKCRSIYEANYLRCFLQYLLIMKKFDCDDKIYISVEIYFINCKKIK